MNIHQLTAEQALLSLRSGPEGLTSIDAPIRLREFGPNTIAHVRGPTQISKLVRQLTHWLAVILWVAAAFAFVAGALRPGQGMFTLGVAIAGVVLVNAVFAFWQEYRAERTLAALQRLLPDLVKTMRDGRLTRLKTAEIVPGDVIYLADGDYVPADCRFIEAFSILVNNATITGESHPQARHADPDPVEGPLAASRNVALAGTSVLAGQGYAVVFATGPNTEFGRIAHLAQSEQDVLSPLQIEIAHLSRIIAVCSLLIGAVLVLVGHRFGLSFWDNFVFAIGIIVANVPEGLLPTMTLSLAIAAQRMASRHMLVRHLPAVETLGSATVICTDKTGTLTENRMRPTACVLSGIPHAADALAAGTHAVVAHEPLFHVALNCQNVKEAETGVLVGDPMEVALVEMARRLLPGAEPAPRIDELPFDSDRRRLTTVHRANGGYVIYTKGALQSVMPLCSMLATEGVAAPLDGPRRAQLIAAESRLASRGLRVLAFAARSCGAQPPHDDVETDLTLWGLVGLEDPPRADVPDAVARCREAGIRVYMISGDHPHTARAIALEVGLVSDPSTPVVTGDALQRLSDTQLHLLFDTAAVVFARTSAADKLRIVRALQRRREVVAVTGDGVNDAPALKAADIGIAMGASGTDVAREASDMILADDNFASIVKAIEEGRGVFDNMRKFVTYILTSNVPELVPFVAFVLLRIPLPLTIVQVLAVDLGTDLVPALGLGAEPPAQDVLKRPPRGASGGLLTLRVLGRAYALLGLMESAAALAAYWVVMRSSGWHWGDPMLPQTALSYRQATTACLTAIVLMQVANVLICRSETRSIFESPLLSNRLIVAGVAIELALIWAIDYTAIGNAIFGTAPIPATVWLVPIPFAVAMIGLDEWRKHTSGLPRLSPLRLPPQP